MIVLLDTSHNLDDCERELGCEVNQLLTPGTRFKPQRPEQEFAIDNSCYAGFDRAAFEALLERERPRVDLCRWVTCPDVVGNARRTLEALRHAAQAGGRNGPRPRPGARAPQPEHGGCVFAGRRVRAARTTGAGGARDGDQRRKCSSKLKNCAC